MSFNTVIFDLDGTLLDTLQDLCDSVNTMLNYFNCREITLREAREYVGNGARNLIKRSLPFEIGENDTEKYLAIFRHSYDNNKSSKTKPYQGIIEMLDILKKNNIKMAVVSNKYYKAVEELNNLFFKDYIDIAIGEKEGISKKPAPDMVFLALSLLFKDRCINGNKDDDDYKNNILTGENQKKKCKHCDNIGILSKNILNIDDNNQKTVENELCKDSEITSLNTKNPISVRSILGNELGVKFDKCVYVGDSEVDIETAKNAGLKCISVTWGFRDRAKLMSLNPYKIVDNTEELINFILK